MSAVIFNCFREKGRLRFKSFLSLKVGILYGWTWEQMECLAACVV